jgi:hypothetical protein
MSGDHDGFSKNTGECDWFFLRHRMTRARDFVIAKRVGERCVSCAGIFGRRDLVMRANRNNRWSGNQGRVC